MPSLRQARVAEMIKRDLSEILQKEMRDPRLGLLTVTNVEVTRDFLFAKVFISVIGEPEEKAAALKALQGASGFLRGQLGRMLDLRSVPQLAFRLDTGIERGVRMFELLQEEGKAFATATVVPDEFEDESEDDSEDDSPDETDDEGTEEVDEMVHVPDIEIDLTEAASP